MEFDTCRLEVYLGITHYFFICLTISTIYKLQAVLIKLVMTSNYTASALFEGGKVQSEYGLTAKCIYIRDFYNSFEGKEENLLEIDPGYKSYI